MASSSQLRKTPPVVPWSTFVAQFEAEWRQGQHCLFNGPAGSGKTVAARTLARIRPYVLVLGTKMRDKEMDAYIAEGYVRINHWPPTRADYRRGAKFWTPGEVRFVLWPHIRNRDDLRKYGPLYGDALDSALVDGGWTIVADEGLWLSDKSGLNLGAQLAALAYTGRSMGITLMMVVQRPRGVPVNCWTNASYAFVWHAGNSDDVRELASLGVEDRRDVVDAVAHVRGHDFVFLPCRSGMEWAISRVEVAT